MWVAMTASIMETTPSHFTHGYLQYGGLPMSCYRDRVVFFEYRDTAPDAMDYRRPGWERFAHIGRAYGIVVYIGIVVF